MTDIVEPPEIDALPPAPQPTDTPEDFDAKSYASLQAQAGMVTQVNATAAATHQNAVAAQERAVAAGTSAGAAALSAAAAQDAEEAAALDADRLATLDALWLGASATNPATGRDGVPLVAGNAYVNTSTGLLMAYTGAAWVAGVATSGGVTTINGQTGAVELPGVLSYALRGNLRSNETWLHALVEGLGWFQWFAGSDEPDDDESCFATASGRWLLQAPHWDVIDQWHLPESSARDAQIEDLGRVLYGAAACGITSVATVASTAFTVTVPGALPGDRVIATPPGALGATDADSARLSFHAYVSAADTVTVRLCNASAATATTSTAAQGAWAITVLKES